MKKENLEDWKNSMINIAKQNYNESKFLSPVAMLITENNQCFIIGMPFSNQEEKEKCVSMLKNIVRQKKAIAILLIHEAYMIAFDKSDKHKVLNPDGTKIMPIKDMDGRKECIVGIYETKSGEREMITIDINDGVLGKQKSVKNGDVDGLFSNFFSTPTWMN